MLAALRSLTDPTPCVLIFRAVKGNMRLHEFIRANIEGILTAWEQELNHGDSSGSPIRLGARRRLTREILLEIATGLQKAGTIHLDVSTRPANPEVAPSNHGGQRLATGYSLLELQTEYRVLRSVVVSEWMKVRHSWLQQEIADMAHFHAALDRALGESTNAYVAGLDRSRDIFVGVLGHDLRGPINAALLNIRLLARDSDLRDQSRAAALRIERSVRQMNELASELLEFVSIHFGRPRPLSLCDVSMSRICEEAIGDAQTLSPDRQFVAQLDDNTTGRWDAHRLRQAVYNLLRNAIDHGAVDAPIGIATRGDKDSVSVEVHSRGEPIPPGSLARIFDPFTQASSGEADMKIQGSIGLGLFIVRDVATMHDGSVSVTSTAEEGTTFRIEVPRNAKDATDVK
ncbi:sensor histidine kinase [Cupriavidus necator]|uniref:sensor histidine kinase n=1 Tax=Cupriavidus necator TaxID=106590 RepID=UPI0039C318E8